MNKGAIALAIIGSVAALVQLWIKHRQTIELKDKEAKAQLELASERTQAAERAARHAREASEREAEREQKEKLIAELQGANKRTLDFLESQLKAQQEAGSKRYDIIERNTSTTSELARAVGEQARELRVLVDRIGRLESGAGCRAGLVMPAPPPAAPGKS